MDNSWLDVSVTTGEAGGLPLASVEFCGDRMVAMGDCGAFGTWFYTDPVTHYLTFGTDDDLINCFVYDVMYIGGTIFACGQADGGYPMTWYNDGTGWQNGWGDAGRSGAYFGIDWYSWGSDVCTYSVGWWDDMGTTRCLYQEYNVTAMAITTISSSLECIFTDIELDTSDSANPRMLITAAIRQPGVYGIYTADKNGGPWFSNMVGRGGSPETEGFMGVDVDHHGTAVIVGSDGTYGQVYSLYRSNGKTVVVKRSDDSSMFSAKDFQDVSIRPGGVQMALTVGSAFKYSYTSVLAPIQVDTAVPHISYIDLYPASDQSQHYLNHQIDVDAGTLVTQYTLSVCIWDSLGIDHVTAMNVWMWYDMGLTGADAPGPFDDASLANQRMRFAINNGAAPTLEFPLSGETMLVGGAWQESGAYAWVNITFSPMEQVRWADSSGGAWNQGAGTSYRYDGDTSGFWNPEDQSDNVGFAPLDEALTWDIKVQIQDDAAVTNYARAYDEFGFYKYTYLGNEGVPNGGSVYGSGAPSANNVPLSPSGSDVSFKSNCPYSLTVGIEGNLTGVAAPANNISAQQVSILGGAVAVETYFNWGASTRTLIGPAQEPLGSGRSTTTSSWDGNAGTSEAIFWEIDIPAVPEDSYTNQLTWSLSS
jgi:hypothetical protein